MTLAYELSAQFHGLLGSAAGGVDVAEGNGGV